MKLRDRKIRRLRTVELQNRVQETRQNKKHITVAALFLCCFLFCSCEEPAAVAESDPLSAAQETESDRGLERSADTAPDHGTTGTLSDQPGEPGTSSGQPGEPGTSSGQPGEAGASSGRPGENGTESGQPGTTDTSSGQPGEAGTSSGWPGITGEPAGRSGEPGGPSGQPPEATGSMSVTFLDVGQGNAVLVECDDRYMLVDGGDREYASFVVGYLKHEGVPKLEYVIASHYDADHLNGVNGVLNAFPCEQVLAADYTTDTRVCESFQTVISEQDIPLAYPALGETYQLGGAEFTIVCPDTYDHTDDNDNSIGIRLVFGDTSFLICGDAGADVEEEMLAGGLELDSDVYLASHHGSDGSSSAEFMQAVSPEAVVISAGAGNSYGHPAARVLDACRAADAALYRTDLQGTLVAVSDGREITWNVEPSDDYRDGDEVAAADENTAETVQADYILNRNTKKFHMPSCPSADDIHPENRAEFTGDRQELIDAGYAPCKRCNP